MPHDGFVCCCHKRRKCSSKACDTVGPVLIENTRCEDREANAHAASETHRTLTSESGVSADNATASGSMDPMHWRAPRAVLQETLRRYLDGEITVPPLAAPGHTPGPELSNFIAAMALPPNQ